MTGKNILSATIVAFVFVFVVAPISYAQSLQSQSQSPQQTQQSLPARQTVQQPSQTRTVTQAQNSNSLKARALREIERRVGKLTNAIEKINSSAKLSDTVKQQMILDLQTEVDSLSDLKATVETETNETAVQEEVATIKDSYSIFAVYMPKVVTLQAAEKVLDIADKMSLTKMRLLTQVSTVGSTGEDTSELEQLLTDAEESIDAASQEAEDVYDTILDLTPEGYPQNRVQFQTARQSIQTARQSLIDAQQSMRSVFTQLQTYTNTQQSASGEAMMQNGSQVRTMEMQQESLGVTDTDTSLKSQHQVQTQQETLQNPSAVSAPAQVIQ